MSGLDLRDLILKASAQVQTVFMDFEREQMQGEVKTQMVTMWSQLPDELKEKFKQEKPEAYKALMLELGKTGKK